MNLPQAHCHITKDALFFSAPLKGWWGVVALRVGALALGTASTKGKMGWVLAQAIALPFVAVVLAI